MLNRLFQTAAQLLRRPVAGAAPARKPVALPPPGVLPFEYLVLPGEQVAQALAQRSVPGHCVPVILGEPARVADLVANLPGSGSFEQVMQQGLLLDVDDWLAQRRSEDPELFEVEGEAPPTDTLQAVEPHQAVRDIGFNRFLPEVVVGLVQVAQPWQVAAVLRPGGWNECPEPAVQLAFFKRWHERYGAVVTAVAGDVIEFQLSNPPQSFSEARKLAEEQFVYCTDIVHQGVGSVDNLATTLRGARNWYFWWD